MRSQLSCHSNLRWHWWAIHQRRTLKSYYWYDTPTLIASTAPDLHTHVYTSSSFAGLLPKSQIEPLHKESLRGTPTSLYLRRHFRHVVAGAASAPCTKFRADRRALRRLTTNTPAWRGVARCSTPCMAAWPAVLGLYRTSTVRRATLPEASREQPLASTLVLPR